MDVSGKAAIVTGGGTGVGRATALALAERGCAVAINYCRSRSDAEQTAREIESRGGRCIAVQADVADDSACRRLVEQSVEAFGRLDVLVNNAAVTQFIEHGNLEDVTDDVWDEIFSVNLRGPFQCVRAARPHLAKDGGIVVNVASTAGINATGSSIPYCASKAALINMTVALARALAPEIRVNAVAPGFITGRWLQNGLGDVYDAIKEAWKGHAPLERVCDPSDVAAAILSFITGSDLVTGQTLICDGGMTIGKARL